MLPFRANLFRIDGPGENNLWCRWEFQGMLNLVRLRQKNKAVLFLCREKRNNSMCQRHSARLLVSRIKNKAVLQFSGDHHLGGGIIKPVFDLLDHVFYVRVDQAIEFIRPEPEPRHRLQKTIRAAVRASASHHKLPELEADDLRVFARPAKLADEIRCSITEFHCFAFLSGFGGLGLKSIVGFCLKENLPLYSLHSISPWSRSILITSCKCFGR